MIIIRLFAFEKNLCTVAVARVKGMLGVDDLASWIFWFFVLLRLCAGSKYDVFLNSKEYSIMGKRMVQFSER